MLFCVFNVFLLLTGLNTGEYRCILATGRRWVFLAPARDQHRLMSACCPLDVRLLSAFKADNKRTSSGQQADIKRTRSGPEAAMRQCGDKACFGCNVLCLCVIGVWLISFASSGAGKRQKMCNFTPSNAHPKISIVCPISPTYTCTRTSRYSMVCRKCPT